MYGSGSTFYNFSLICGEYVAAKKITLRLPEVNTDIISLYDLLINLRDVG
jgi:hypothetical protein